MLDVEVKICTKCKNEKSFVEFSFRDRAKNKRHPWCRPCTRKHNMSRYHNNRSYYKNHHTILTKNSRREKMRKLLDYLANHPCIDCGETDPIVLEFAHRDNSVKVEAVTQMVTNNCGWDKISNEIQKCDIRCANCHRRRTARERGYTRFLLLEEVK